MSQKEFIEENEDVQEMILDLKARGFSIKKITTKLNEEFPAEKFTDKGISLWIDSNAANFGQVIRKSAEIRKESAEKMLSTMEQLEKVNKEMWKVFYEISEQAKQKYNLKCKECGAVNEYEVKDYKLLIQSADHLLKQIDLIMKKLGELKQTKLNVTYNINDLSEKLIDAIRIFERKGYIKILNRKGFRRLEETKNEIAIVQTKDGEEDDTEGETYEV